MLGKNKGTSNLANQDHRDLLLLIPPLMRMGNPFVVSDEMSDCGTPPPTRLIVHLISKRVLQKRPTPHSRTCSTSS